MTTECALAKLSYLIGKNKNVEWVRQQLKENLRGELTLVSKLASSSSSFHFLEERTINNNHNKSKPRFSLLDENFIRTVAKSLNATTKGEAAKISKALNPVLLCAAAGAGDLEGSALFIYLFIFEKKKEKEKKLWLPSVHRFK